MRRFDALVPALVCFVLAIGSATIAFGQEAFTFGAGYSHVDFADAGNLLHGKDGPYIDLDLAVKVPQQRLPIWASFAFTGSGYFESAEQTVSLSPGTSATANLYSDVGFFEMEPRVSLAFYSDQRTMRGFFVKPRVGMGLLIDSYGIDHVTQSATNVHFSTEYHTGLAFEIRPAVHAGYSWGPGEVGAEISYMSAWGDFGDLGNKAQEFRAGAFYAVKF